MLGKRSDWQIIRPGLGNRLSTQRSLDSTMEPFDEAICCRVVSSCSNPCGAEDRRLLVRVPGFKFSPTVGSYSNGDAKTTEPSGGTCNSIRRGSGNWKTFRSSCKSFHGCEKKIRITTCRWQRSGNLYSYILEERSWQRECSGRRPCVSVNLNSLAEVARASPVLNVTVDMGPDETAGHKRSCESAADHSGPNVYVG